MRSIDESLEQKIVNLIKDVDAFENKVKADGMGDVWYTIVAIAGAKEVARASLTNKGFKLFEQCMDDCLEAMLVATDDDV
jgi:hypothetical protein